MNSIASCVTLAVAVQTLRNSLMSATLTAATAALALMGVLVLQAPHQRPQSQSQ